MKVSSLLPLGFSISCITGCSPGSSNAVDAPQPFDVESSTEIGSTTGIGITADVQPAADIESATECSEYSEESSDEDEPTGGLPPARVLPPVSDDPTSAEYLWKHGYYHIIGSTNAIQFYTDRFSRPDGRVVLRILVDQKQKFTRVYENNLEYQTPDRLNLDIEDIYQGLCHEYKTDSVDMSWIAMDIVDEFWRTAISHYREQGKIDPTEEIIITPEHSDWDFFITNRYYLDASRMVPETEIIEVTVSREERPGFKNSKETVVADVIKFRFKRPQSSEEDNAIDPPKQDTAESSSMSKPATIKTGPRRTLQILFDETKKMHDANAEDVENVGTSGNPENVENVGNVGTSGNPENVENVGSDKNGGSGAHGENDAKLGDEDDKALDDEVSRYIWGANWKGIKTPSNGKTDNAESSSGPSGSETVPEIVPASS